MKKLAALIFLLALSVPAGLLLPQASAAASCPVFLRSFGPGYDGSGVRTLQAFLNAHGFPVAPSGPGSPGHETTRFGGRTKIALASWQASNGIRPASGYLGALTRAKIALTCASAGLSSGVQTAKPPLGFGSGNGATSTPALSNPVPVLATQVLPPSASATTTPAAAAAINPQSIVGVLCYYNIGGNQIQLMKGSGVIVNPQGYVLTARHLVDPAWTLQAYAATLTPDQQNIYSHAVLNHCEIGLPDSGTALPGPADIQSYNPSIPISRNFQYGASTYFVPSPASMSENEYDLADFAVLKITSPLPGCLSSCSFTAGNFPYTPVWSQSFPGPGGQILSYGYPAEAGINQSGANFYDFFLKGAVGATGGVMNGDQRFAGQAMTFAFESNDIQGGRSGSPVFWQGRVIGILYGSTSTSESWNINMSTIVSILTDAGYGWVPSSG